LVADSGREESADHAENINAYGASKCIRELTRLREIFSADVFSEP
jgi:hypothetical protein